MGWWSEDGQVYDSWDKFRAANTRYRQQENRNKLLAEQNELLKRIDEREEEEEKEQKRKEREERQGDILENIENALTCYTLLQGVTTLDDIKEIILETLDYIEGHLKDDIEYLVDIKNDIIETQQDMKKQSNFDKRMSMEWIKINERSFEDFEDFYIKEMNLFEDCIEQRKKLNINLYDELYDECYNKIVNYQKERFSQINQEVRLQIKPFEDSSMQRMQEREREEKKKYILSKLEIEKNIILKINSFQEDLINKLNKDKKNYEKTVKDIKEKINGLKNIIGLNDLKQIKEEVINVDLDFSSEIISDVYSLEEVVLMVKRHIKELENEQLILEEKEKYYILIDYLINNKTDVNLNQYINFDENIDYKNEYNKILKYEKEAKELENKRNLDEELKRDEENKKRLKQDEQNRIEKQKTKEKEMLKIFKQSKKDKKQVKGAMIMFYVLTIPVIYFIWKESNMNGYILIGGGVVEILFGLIFSKVFNTKRRYLSMIKPLGFENIEDFEKEICKIKNN